MAILYCPGKSAMQTGKRFCATWILDLGECESIEYGPMNWCSGKGSRVILRFNSLKDALSYIEKEKLVVKIIPADSKKNPAHAQYMPRSFWH